MRRSVRVAVTTLCVTGLSGLLPLPAHVPQMDASATSAKVPTAVSAVTAVPFCVRTGTTVSPLTGLRKRSGLPIVTKVNNMVKAWPQAGLEWADLNFVEEIENGYTRHVAVFSTSYPKRVGSIRSARETDIELQTAFGHPAMVYSGAAKVVNAKLRKAAVPTFNEANFPRGLTRDLAKGKTNGRTNNLYADLSKVASVATARGARRLSTQAWCFGAAQPGGRAVVQVKVAWPHIGVAGSWNAKTRKWIMSYRLASGRPYPARNERGRNLTVDNVVVILASRTTARIAYSGGPLQTIVPWTHTIGRGGALVLRDGRAYTAVWTRNTNRAFRLTSTRGRTIRLHPGHTWFLLATQGRTLTVTPSGARPIVSVLPAGRSVPKVIARAVNGITVALPAKAKPAAQRTLRLGSRGSDVAVVQRKLRVTPASGYFWTRTKAAVVALQRRNHLAATGVVNAATWRLINRLP